MNATSLGIFGEQDPVVAFAIIVGELVQLLVFLGLGIMPTDEGRNLRHQNEWNDDLSSFSRFGGLTAALLLFNMGASQSKIDGSSPDTG